MKVDLTLAPSSVADMQGYPGQIPRLLYLCASVSLPLVVVSLSLFSCLPFVHSAQWASGLCWELSLLDDVFAAFKALT